MSVALVSPWAGRLVRVLIRDAARRETYLGDLAEEWHDVAAREGSSGAQRWLRAELRRGLAAFALRDARIALMVGIVPITIGYVAHVAFVTEANQLDRFVRSLAAALGGGWVLTMLRLVSAVLCGILAGMAAAAVSPRRPLMAATAFAIASVPIALLMYPAAGAHLPTVLRVVFRLAVVPAGVFGGLIVYLLGAARHRAQPTTPNEDVLD